MNDMKKSFYGLITAIAVVGLFISMISCSGDKNSNTARLKTDVQNAIKEVVNMEAVNVDDTLIVLKGGDTTVSVKDATTDSVIPDSALLNRPIYVEVSYCESDLDGDDIVGIVAIVGVYIGIFGGGVLLFFFMFYYWFKAKRDRNRVIETAIQNNAKIDPIIFDEYKSPRTRLHGALVWMAWGLGLFVFCFFIDCVELAGIGAVPFFVGLAKLITYFLEDRKQSTEKTNEDIDAE